jgi:hypothetical protein
MPWDGQLVTSDQTSLASETVGLLRQQSLRATAIDRGGVRAARHRRPSPSVLPAPGTATGLKQSSDLTPMLDRIRAVGVQLDVGAGELICARILVSSRFSRVGYRTDDTATSRLP